jgi:hypothetical protein
MTETRLPLADVIRARGFPAEIVEPGVPMPTVDAAAAAMGVAPERIFKSIQTADIIRLSGARVADVAANDQ